MVKKVLIFGAGSAPDDIERWNDFWASPARREFQHAEWYGMTLNPVVDCHNCLEGDFNSIEDLEKYTRGYDMYLFDVSTAKFLKWNVGHLDILFNNMNNRALLLIPVESYGAQRYDTSRIRYSEANVRQLINAEIDEIRRDDGIYYLMVGSQYPLPTLPISWTEHAEEIKCIQEEIEYDVIDKNNIQLFVWVFGPDDCNIREQGYPIADAKLRQRARDKEILDMKDTKYYVGRKVVYLS